MYWAWIFLFCQSVPVGLEHCKDPHLIIFASDLLSQSPFVMIKYAPVRFLIHQQFIRHIHSTAQRSSAIQKVTIIGSGTMGSGIAQVAAQSGHSVQVVDLNEKVLEQSRNMIHLSLQRIAKKKFQDDNKAGENFVSDILGRMQFITDVESAVKDSDLIMEAIVENLQVKQDLFHNLDKMSPENAILASNTSSCSIEEICQKAHRSDRVVGLHFFNPVPVMKLVEVIRIPQTSEDTYNKVMTWAKSLGKVPVTCKDTPGFIVNRLLIPLLTQAARIVQQGDATSEDIDTAMKLGCGHPIGPLELIDLVGVDIHVAAIDILHKRLPDSTEFKDVPLLRQMMKENKLGRKTGEGFNKYSKK